MLKYIRKDPIHVSGTCAPHIQSEAGLDGYFREDMIEKRKKTGNARIA
jgi:hypothetical protein